MKRWRTPLRILSAIGVAVPVGFLLFAGLEVRFKEIALVLALVGFVSVVVRILAGEDEKE